MKPRAFVLLAVIVSIAAWLFLRSRGTEQAGELTSGPRNELAAPVPEQAPPREIITNELPTNREAVSTPIPPTEPADAVPAPAPADSIHLYGFVLPCEGADDIGPPVSVAATDRFGVLRRSDVGAEGEYSFANLTSGRYWLRAQSMSAGEVRLVVDLDAAAGDRRVDLRLEPPLEVIVEVVDTLGAPFRGAPVLGVATSEPPGPWFDEVRGSWNNTFGVGSWADDGFGGVRLPAPAIGRIRLLTPPPVFVSLVHYQCVLGTQRVEAGGSRVRFVLDPASRLLQQGRLRFRLVDATTRAALPRVRVEAHCHTSSEGTTDDEGVCRIQLPPGLVELRVQEGKEHEDAERVVRIEPGEEVDLGDIALGPGVEIAGRVVDESGAGIAGSRLLYEPASDKGSSRSQFLTAVFSNVDGTFRIERLPPAVWRIRYSDPKQRPNGPGAAVVEVDARGGSVANVQLKLVPGVALGVHAADGRWQGVRFTVIDSQGLRILTRPLYGPEPQRVLLAPGGYEVETTIAGVVVATRRAIVIEREPVELALP